MGVPPFLFRNPPVTKQRFGGAIQVENAVIDR
jgi:hypothetical protein